ncbi:hypothetical protein JHU04_004006 [Brenneria sp. 4F2]|nr:hypothetical protein [Brenneria bubanii]
MTEFYVLVQEQSTLIGTLLVIGLVALFYDELAAGFQTLWKKPETLEGIIIRRRHFPAQKTLTLIDNFYSYIPVHTLESEKYVLDVEANGQCYQVETSEMAFRRLSVGDKVTIHHQAG